MKRAGAEAALGRAGAADTGARAVGAASSPGEERLCDSWGAGFSDFLLLNTKIVDHDLQVIGQQCCESASCFEADPGSNSDTTFHFDADPSFFHRLIYLIRQRHRCDNFQYFKQYILVKNCLALHKRIQIRIRIQQDPDRQALDADPVPPK
jgi:hypothetical protein